MLKDEEEAYMSGSRGLYSSIHERRSGKTDELHRRHTQKTAIGILLMVVALLYCLPGMQIWAAVAPKETKYAATPEVQDVAYPANLFDNGKARHFQHKTGDGVTVRYFIMKSSDGVIRAAFDACDVCWREGKGYTQKDDFMVCTNCGKRFPSVKINEVTGGCNPAPLIRKVENGKVIIKVENIMEGKKYFAFGGGK
jgi:uncharacterized membrane protein